ncbi:MAG TPA: 3-isopropylmalate dehydratase small subunit [Gammaproteobacteria bacterium]|nr:3-isopropylmalate dehydratase small subunit [Gammaproteobacteria bacterium]
MKPFTVHTGKVVPLMQANIDTDIIMPKQFLTSIERTGYGDFIFDAWRYLDKGEPGMDCHNRPRNPNFPLNFTRYLGATILLTGPNFGCGSSREHAPWGLFEYGFHVISASSFADIFYNNCIQNGILPIVLPQHIVESLCHEVEAQIGYLLTVDLAAQSLRKPNKETLTFSIDSMQKNKLLSGKDSIEYILNFKEKIVDFEHRHRQEAPWLYNRLKEEK